MRKNNFAPYMSLLMIILTLFVLVFMKMEVRRVGYSVFSQFKSYRQLQGQHHLKLIEYAKSTNLFRLEKIAINNLAMNKIRKSQIVQLSGSQIALRQ